MSNETRVGGQGVARVPPREWECDIDRTVWLPGYSSGKRDGRGSKLWPLGCPACGFEYIHHDVVTVASRSAPDRGGVVVTVADGCARVQHEGDRSRRYAGRRDDLTVRFWCESCDDVTYLRIIQHKGNTFIGWARPQQSAPGARDRLFEEKRPTTPTETRTG